MLILSDNQFLFLTAKRSVHPDAGNLQVWEMRDDLIGVSFSNFHDDCYWIVDAQGNSTDASTIPPTPRAPLYREDTPPENSAYTSRERGQ